MKSRVSLRVMVEGVEFVLAEPAALLVAQRRCDLVLLQPGSDAGQVVLVDERQTVSLEKAAEVDSDDCIELIVRNGVHQDGQGTVVTVAVEGEFHFSVFELESFHDLKLVLGFFCEGVVGCIRKDDVVEKRDIEDVASLLELVRLVHVRGTRGGIPARVVVEEDDRGCVAEERFLDDAPVVDLRRLDGSDGNHLLGQRKVGSIQEEDPGLLVIEVTEVFAQVTCCLGRCFDRGVGCVVCLLLHNATV